VVSDENESAEPLPFATEEPAPPAPARLKRRPDVRVRLGPICLPSAALAWGLSIAAHGALLGIGVVALRSARDVPPEMTLARGDGGEDGGEHGSFFVEPGAGGGANLSAPIVPAPPAMPQSQAAASMLPEPGVDEQVSDWTARPVPPLPASEVEVSETAVVGLPRIAPVGGEPFPARGGQTDAAGAGPWAAAGAGRFETPGGVANGSGARDGGGGASRAASDGVPGAPGIPGGVADASLPSPAYPRESRLRGEEGTVVVEVNIGAEGVASDFRVVDDAGFPRLADAALAAVRKARFRPAIENGRAVACSVRIPFRFRLRNPR
jgi:periplasmic protein TonB